MPTNLISYTAEVQYYAYGVVGP